MIISNRLHWLSRWWSDWKKRIWWPNRIETKMINKSHYRTKVRTWYNGDRNRKGPLKNWIILVVRMCKNTPLGETWNHNWSSSLRWRLTCINGFFSVPCRESKHLSRMSRAISLQSARWEVNDVCPVFSSCINAPYMYSVFWLKSNLSNIDTEGTERSVRIREVSI